MAINGKSGEVIWRFDKTTDNQKWYACYNAQLIKDQNKDGLEDILISNGGNVCAAPHDTKKRPPGKLLIISAKDGKLIAEASMPDKFETYMSVSAISTADSTDYNIIFGTGGETVGGHLYVT